MAFSKELSAELNLLPLVSVQKLPLTSVKGIKPMLGAFKNLSLTVGKYFHLLLEEENVYEGESEFQTHSEDLCVTKGKSLALVFDLFFFPLILRAKSCPCPSPASLI